MSRRKHKKSWRMRISHDELVGLAPQIWTAHGGLVSDGYRVQPSSGLWRRRNGTLTARLVYRHPGGAGKVDTLVVTVKGIRVDNSG